jgi:uncharacterized SAM-binding protein YcdF (DUF218 family)
MLSRRQFHARTAAVLGLTGGGAWLLGCGVVVLAARRLHAGNHDDGEARPALVLGCPPGPAFLRRLEAAAGLFQAGQARFIVVSGRNEADWGAARLRSLGVPEAALRLEGAARNTWETLHLSRPLLGEGAFHLVTDRWHLPRATVVARSLGLDVRPLGAASPWRARTVLREGLSVVMSVSGGHVTVGGWADLLRRQPA